MSGTLEARIKFGLCGGTTTQARKALFSSWTARTVKE